MSAANTASRPVLNLTGADTLNGNPSVSFTYDQGSFSNGFRSLTGAPTGPVPQAMACVSKYKSFDPSALQTLICAGAYDAGATSWGAWIAATGAGAAQDGGGYGRGCTTTTDADLLPHVHVSTFDGTVVRYYIDGFLVATSTPPVPPAANSVNTRNGKIGIYKNDAGSSVAAAAHYDAQWPVTHLSEAVIRKYSRQCAEKFGLWKVGLVYCNGDSITAGNTLTSTSLAWPALLASASLVNDGAIELINAGVGLRTMDQIANLVGIADLTNAAFSGQRRFGPNKIGNVEIIWAGTNDNYASSESAANIWADMQTRANASIAKGFVPILGTMLRRAGGTGGQETVRTTVNDSIRNGPHRYFDLAENAAFISTASVAQNVVGFHDGIHPSEAAHAQVIAPAIAAAINLAIAEESPT
jgi:lysophospholipase L1-like esterase